MPWADMAEGFSDVFGCNVSNFEVSLVPGLTSVAGMREGRHVEMAPSSHQAHRSTANAVLCARLKALWGKRKTQVGFLMRPLGFTNQSPVGLTHWCSSPKVHQGPSGPCSMFV